MSEKAEGDAYNLGCADERLLQTEETELWKKAAENLDNELREVKAKLKTTHDIMTGLHDFLMGIVLSQISPPPRVMQAFMDRAATLRREALPPALVKPDGRPLQRGDS